MKKVILKLGSGSLQSGFDPVIAELLEPDGQSSIQLKGSLPPAPELADVYQKWQDLYSIRYQNQSLRINVLEPIGLRYSESEFCAICERLTQQLNAWLDSELFRPIDKELRTELSRNDDIQFIIATDHDSLRKLPWHLWTFFEDYSKAEIALSALNWRELPVSPLSHDKVRILAVLGDSSGIDVAADCEVLKTLPNTELIFLQEPNRQVVNEHLWHQQGWDILFFAGHSQTEGQSGQIFINSTESLTISQFKHSLKQAIEGGLKVAIFNSCDGLGLAQQLADLHIPYIIVMRQFVPDRVAQAFLKYFLQAFAAGKSFHLAVRQARQRLEGFEGELPCASWLPVIWQNPTAVSFYWMDLLEKSTEPPTARARPSRGFSRSSWRTVLFTSAITTSVMMGIRSLGVIEPLELAAYDYAMRQRPTEAIDPRILVVEVTQDDTNNYNYPLPDMTLAEVIKKLQHYQPHAIGIDIHRSQARGQGNETLTHQFEASHNLFMVCSYGSTDENYAPPPTSSPAKLRDQVGFSDLLVDEFTFNFSSPRRDLVVGKQLVTESVTVRRQLLSYDPSLAPSSSTCSTPYSLSFQLAFQFLLEAGIQPLEVNRNEEWQFGKIAFPELSPRFGGYQQLDEQSSQILINYRSNQPGQQVTLEQILTDQIKPDLIQNKIVLVGYTAPVARDYFNSPYGNMAGVWIHAHMVSQMISAVVDDRPLMWTLPQWKGMQWGDALWIASWSVAGGVLAWGLSSKSLRYLGFAVSLLIFVLCQSCLLIFAQGGWMPLVPSALSLLVTASINRPQIRVFKGAKRL
jgi:CHASE2 domain-containing sensor protein